MCGIIGYLGREQAWPIIIKGLRRLEYRGYDSAGIVVVGPSGQFQFRKTVGKVNGLEPFKEGNFPQGTLGLGHTRWATHGRPSDANAHPHTDCHQRVAVVHNGIVENFLPLREELKARQHRFSSDTDTEVIAHLLEEGLDQGLSFEDAFRRLGHLLKGSQAVTAIMQGAESKICALRLGHAGGIVAANLEGQGIVCSDLPALLPLLNHGAKLFQVGFLESGEMVALTAQGAKYSDLEGTPLQKQLRTIAQEDILVDKGGHRHFMLKEIMEQPQAIASALRQRVDFQAGKVHLPDFPISTQDIRRLRRVMLIGCGTSLHAAQVGRHWMETLAGLPAEAESSSEFRYRHTYIDKDTLVVSVGQSGETADTVAAMQLAQEKEGRLITICNVTGSQATRIAEGTLYMQSGIEIGVASTKTFIASLTILNLLAIYLGQERGLLEPQRSRELVDDLAHIPELVGQMLADATIYQRLARRFYTYNNFLFLGRGPLAPIASEGALKLKEISYIHAEGYPAGEMKHGPIALIDQGMATLALAPRDALYDKMVNSIKEVRARDGVALAVLTQGDEELPPEVDECVSLPEAPEHLLPLLATVPLQLLAYHIAVHKGCDVDQPRNLAKSVTVE